MDHSLFPRLRRLRHSPWIRELVAETTLHPQDLIWPLFIRTSSSPQEIPTLPGVERHTLEALPSVLDQAIAWGIPAVALFPVIDPNFKTAHAREAVNADNLICQAIRIAKAHAPQLGLIADVALDPYTDHGHDGILCGHHIANDQTLEILCAQALVLVEAGADALGPSDMMDGRIQAIRSTLCKAGFIDRLIMSYSAKYASAFYEPFRQAIQAQPLTQGLTDKLTYQLSPTNAKEALRCAQRDEVEGADILIVKPALPYLDILQTLTTKLTLPIFAYHVSGEYAALKAAHANGYLNLPKVLYESLLAIKRAGATGILTYGVPDIMAYWESSRKN